MNRIYERIGYRTRHPMRHSGRWRPRRRRRPVRPPDRLHLLPIGGCRCERREGPPLQPLAVESGCFTLAVHLLYPQFMNDETRRARACPALRNVFMGKAPRCGVHGLWDIRRAGAWR